MRRTPYAPLCLFAAGLSAACVDINAPGLDFSGFDGGFGCSRPDCYAIEFMVTPMDQYVLRGDSIRFSILSTTGRNDAYWTSTGSVALVRPDGALDSTVTTARTDVWARALTAGRGLVRARHSGSGFHDSATVVVADSTAIAGIVVYVLADGGLRAGTDVPVDALLLDSIGQSVRGSPTTWSVSDTTVATISGPETTQDRATRFRLSPKKPGTTSLNFGFLAVTKTVPLTVAP